MKQNYYLLTLLFVVSLFSSVEIMAQQTCYTISDSENKIYKFNLSTGSIISSQALSSCSSPEASTLNLEGDTLFILNQDELHYINFTSGSLSNTKVSGSDISSQKLTGALGDKYISDFDAMGVDTAGNIWAGSSNNNPCLMVVIDRSTGQVQEDFFGAGVDYLQVQNTNWSALRFDAMAFDPITNELYANMNGTSQNYDYLFRLNTTTGAMTLVRQFNTISDIEGMMFDAIGDLYVSTGANATNGSNDNTLWHVDLINGEVTKKLKLWGGDNETCDCIIGDPTTAVEVSGYVFYDVDKDTVLNNSDMGSSGYLVSIYEDVNGNGQYDSGTDDFVDSMRTYADGYYQFRLSYTSGTERYVLVTDTNDKPSDAYYTTDNIEIAVFTAGKQKDENNNFGFGIDSSQYYNIISGTVFGDANEDGDLDNGEDGVTGVKVYLYDDKNCNGSKDDSDVLLDSTIVGMDGKYSFLREYDPDTTSSTASISKRISYKYDDAEEKSNGDMSRTSDDLDLGEYWVGLRFQDLSIPQGATISSAYIQFTAEDSDNTSTSLRIYGEDENDVDEFSSSDNDITDRDRTSNYVDWSPSSWSSNGTYNSAELKTVVQEIVDRGGWSSGNNMAFLIKPTSGDRDAISYDNNSSKAPLLYVEYQTGSGSVDTTDCYVTCIDESTKPAGSSLTTDNIETAVFTSGGNHDSMNNFGLWGGSLPVEWLSFKARFIGDDVLLEWATAMEENNSHFVVERSANGEEWVAIGEINGAGFSTQVNRYDLMDMQALNGTSYYRIKQVDFDGKYSYSHTEVLHKQKLTDIGMNISPNPASDFVEVSWVKNLNAATGSLQLLNMQGQVIKNYELERDQMVEIDLTDLDRGFYIVEIRTPMRRFTKKLLHK